MLKFNVIRFFKNWWKAYKNIRSFQEGGIVGGNMPNPAETIARLAATQNLLLGLDLARATPPNQPLHQNKDLEKRKRIKKQVTEQLLPRLELIEYHKINSNFTAYKFKSGMDLCIVGYLFQNCLAKFTLDYLKEEYVNQFIVIKDTKGKFKGLIQVSTNSNEGNYLVECLGFYNSNVSQATEKVVYKMCDDLQITYRRIPIGDFTGQDRYTIPNEGNGTPEDV